MGFDSLGILTACVLFASSIGAWILSVSLRAGARLYVRFSAMLFAALAVSLPVGISDAAALFLLPLAAAALMIAAFARFAMPLHVVVASLALVAGFAGGLAALLSGYVMLALGPVVFAAIAIVAVALNGAAVMPVLAAAALLGSALVFLVQGAHEGLFLFCASALVGLAKPVSGGEKSALAIQQ